MLRLLRESYLGKVKMIYIDPPYNTGNDFIYRDDFAQSVNDYAEALEQYDEDENRLFRNTDSNGRVFGRHAQRLAELILAEAMSIGSFSSKVATFILAGLAQSCGRWTMEPAFRRGLHVL